MAQPTICDVVVVGGGVSGMTAAYHLKKKDPSMDVIVLEANDRFGGRTCGAELNTSNGREYFDVGGQWVSSAQPHITQLLTELDLETYPQHTEGIRLIQMGSGPIGYYKGDIPALPWYALIDLKLLMNKIDRRCRMVPAVDPSLCVRAREWDNITCDHFLRQHAWTNTVYELCKAVSRTVHGLEPEHFSLLYYLFDLSAAGGLEPVISNQKGGGQEAKVKGGAFNICDILAEKIGRRNIHLNKPVISVDQTENLVSVTTQSGDVYKCTYVIMASPPTQTGNIEFKPMLPPEKLHVMRRMPVGNLIKVLVTYRKAFWREAGMSGTVITSGGETQLPGCTAGPVGLVEDACLPSGSPALVVFIGGKQQQEYCKLEANERRQAVLDNLSQLFGPEAEDCLDYMEKDWNQESYIGGCPKYSGTPGMMTWMAPALRKPYHRLFFAGTESATVWNGFINGAVQAGIRAANEVLYEVRPQAIDIADLVDTVHGPNPADDWLFHQRKKFRRRKVLRWTLGLGGFCALLVVAKKAYFRIAI